MKQIYNFKPTSIYKSKPLINEVSKLDTNFISKYIFNIIFLFLLSTLCWISLGLTLIHADTNLLVIKATLIFAINWYLVFLTWWIIQTKWYFKLTKNNDKYWAVFSFLPIINIVMIILLFKQISFKEFFIWFSWIFVNNKFETNPNNYKTKQYYCAIAALIIMCPLLYFVFVYSKDVETIIEYHNLWFDGVHFFTIQTNLLCFIFILIYVINPRINLFNNDSVLICLISYIFIVSFTYNALLLPFIIKDLLMDNPLYLLKTIWTHMVNPFMFIGVGISIMKLNSKCQQNIRDYLSLLKFGMVIPTVYLLYTLFLPFMSDKSVYGPITNCNPGTPNSTPLFGLEHGSPIMLIPIITFWFVFVGVITGFWTLKYYFNNKCLRLNLR